MLDVRVRAFVLAVWLASMGIAAFGQEPKHKVTLKGKLFTSGEDNCHFFLDPEGDSESVGLDASSGVYLCDWLAGSNTKSFTVILIPE